MKTRNLIVAALLIFVGSIAVQAADSESAARDQLENRVYQIVSDVPFSEYINIDECCKVTLVMRVNQDASVTEFRVYGENQAVVKWIENELKRSNLTADPQLIGGTYRMVINFKYQF